VAVSAGVAESLRSDCGVPQDRIRVIPGAVDLDAIRRRAGDGPLLSGGFLEGTYAIAVGRLVRQKGIADLIEAAADVVRRRPFKLLIVGGGPLHAQLQQMITDLGLESVVYLAGFVQNPYPLIRRARLLVSASRFEGLPLTLIEALALAVPVVATDCPSGPREILDGGRYGLLVPVGRPDRLADAMDRILSDPALAAELAARGPARAEAYALSRVTAQYLRLLRSLGVDVPSPPSGF
jgi:glycosyltransferase involved in cell wall biosynthesis